VQFTCGDLADVQGKYEVLSLIEVLEHIHRDQVSEFVRSLRSRIEDQGAMLISVPTINIPRNRKHYQHFSMETLEDAISPEFQMEKHWWLYKDCLTEKVLLSSLCNRLFTLNWTRARRTVWVLHKRFSYMATASTGRHLVCLARPRA